MTAVPSDQDTSCRLSSCFRVRASVGLGQIRSIAELAVDVVAPRTCRARGRQPAGMHVSRDELHEGQSAAHRHWREVIGRGSVAQLTERILPPAIGRARRRQAAAVKGAGRELRETHASGHERRHQSVRLGSVADLAGGAIAPAIGGAAGNGRTGMVERRGQMGGS